MPRLTSLLAAKWLAFLLPAGLILGAFGFQYLGGLFPCEMCWWQRYAHMAALVCAMMAFLAGPFTPDRGRMLVLLAAAAIAGSGAIGVYHAGVEAHILPGFTQCTSSGSGGSAEDVLNRIMASSVIRCDQVQWRFIGLSMAAWNAILSLAGALTILWLSLKPSRTR